MPDHTGLVGRAFKPTKYVIGYLDPDGTFVPTSWTDHGLTYVPPSTMPDRRTDRSHGWHEANVRVLATHRQGEACPHLGWEHDAGIGWPAMTRTQLATANAFFAIAPEAGLRPGSHIVEATALRSHTLRPARPIAPDPGGPLDNWTELAWRDAHNGQRFSRPSTDRNDPDPDAVVFPQLRDAACAWTRPHIPHLPDVVIIDRSLIRYVGRRGVAMIETNDTPAVTDIDPAALLADAYHTLGALRFAQITGGTIDDGKNLGRGRQPGAAKVTRLLPATPKALARLADQVAGAAPRCAYDGCTTVIKPRSTYCAEHAVIVRRARDRNRKRAARRRVRETKPPTSAGARRRCQPTM